MEARDNYYLGKGIGFPIQLDNGSARVSKGVDLIRLAIPNILSWYYSQRYFQGEYGSKWERMVEKPLDTITLSLVRTFIIEAITRYEKRIKLLAVNLVVQNEKIYAHLKYKVILDNTTDSFIIPFYKIITR